MARQHSRRAGGVINAKAKDEAQNRNGATRKLEPARLAGIRARSTALQNITDANHGKRVGKIPTRKPA